MPAQNRANPRVNAKRKDSWLLCTVLCNCRCCQPGQWTL